MICANARARGEHDHRQPVAAGADLGQRSQPVLARQSQVQDEHVKSAVRAWAATSMPLVTTVGT
jgi:hypothetical protein